ncbi:MAG: Fic/DOC family N-terminal domain-containing protein [Erysipelotrichaceae bacterium]
MNRSGIYKSNFSGDMMYKSFLPNVLPPKPDIVMDEELLRVLVDASSSLAKLDAISSRLPSVPLFISMYVRKEALLSSQIDGTQVTNDDVLDPHIAHN